jgi:hypothetical protein
MAEVTVTGNEIFFLLFTSTRVNPAGPALLETLLETSMQLACDIPPDNVITILWLAPLTSTVYGVFHGV